MYDKRAKQDALDLWFSMPGEMSVDDFAAELGLPFGQHRQQLDQGGSQAQPTSTAPPVLPKLEAIRRVRGRGTGRGPGDGADPQQVRYSGKVRPRGHGGAAGAREEEEWLERPWTRETRRASRPARPMPASSRRGCRRSCPTLAALQAIIADLEPQQRRAQGGVGRP